MSALFSILVDDTPMWLGAYDRDRDDVFYWVDDTHLEYSNWYTPGEPDHDTHDYVEMGTLERYDGEWFDSFDYEMHALCAKHYTFNK